MWRSHGHNVGKMPRDGAKRIGALVEKDHPWAVNFWQAAGYNASTHLLRFIRNV